MDYQEYRRRGKEMVDYIADYLENIRDRRVYPDVKPGYMRLLLPDHAPEEGESWDSIIEDVNKIVMPGITHWQSPYMHAYFPALNSPPSLLGDMLADALNCICFTWASSPACTELETLVMNWLGRMLDLPDEFLHLRPDSPGGGVIQTTASESTFVALLAARTEVIRRFKEARKTASLSSPDDSEINSLASDQLSMRADLLQESIQNDKQNGLIPFFVCGTLGTTGACAFDNLEEIGPICKKEDMWIHVDAAYAGSAFTCPEFRVFMKGIEYADSFTFNPSKWLMVHFDCTAMWVKRSEALHRTFNVDPLYLKHENSGLAIDYMHWQIPLSKRFRSLKLWFVLRSFGIKGIQQHIRKGVTMAQKFEEFVNSDKRFEIPAKRHLGMVVFRLKGDNELTEKLLKKLNSGGQIHCVPASLKNRYVIRFTITSQNTTLEDVKRDWTIINTTATEVLKVYSNEVAKQSDIRGRRHVPIGDIKALNPDFGSSLHMLKEFTAKLAELKEVAQNSPVIRRKLRGLMNSSSRQYSLDTAMDIVHTVHNCTNQSNTENAVGDATNNVEKSDVADATEDFNGVEDQTRLTKMGTSMTSSISNEM
ncbi:Histidine decarboxylase [Nymphon striatum]|nr:Histidine decarboxylase [Nymphon striatum]